MSRRFFTLALMFAAAFSMTHVSMPKQAQAQQSFEDFLSGLFRGPGPAGRQNVKIFTNHAPGTIIVSFGDRRLYYMTGKGSAISYPIAIPKPQARWAGVSYISRKEVNPSWTPTPQMRRENPKLPAFVPGGDPRNPLGVRALYLGDTLYRIHGTDAPWLIGDQVSRGCVRMYNNDVIDLYDRTRIGAKVVVTWDRFRTI
jgi:lipoprotein-anchoring transpeptidase ErfK/SrfK